MIKFLFYLILSISLFPFRGHLTILALLSTFLIIIFIKDIFEGNIIIYQKDFKYNKYYMIFMIVLFFYSIISIFWSIDINGWIYYNIYLYIALVMLIVSTTQFKNTKQIYKVIKFISITTIIHNLIGWINIIFDLYILSSSPLIKDFQEKNNPLSLFNNTNDFATFLVFSIFICIIIVKTSNKKYEKIIYSATILSSIFLIYKTMSRANYIALAIGMMSFFFLISKNKKIMTTITLVFSGLVVSIILLPDVYKVLNNVIFTRILNSGDLIRINLMKNGINFFKDSLGIGIGAGNIPYYLENRNSYNNFGVISIHNWWLEILVTYGLFAFVFYVKYYIKLIIDFYKRTTQNDEFSRNVSIGFLSILISYLVGSISTSTNFPIIWIWNVFSVMITFIGIEKKDHDKTKFISSQ